MVQVLFDNRNIIGLLTNDKIVHLIWTDIQEENVTPFSFFTNAAGSDTFGVTKFGDDTGDELEEGTQVLFHHPFNPLNIGKLRFLNKENTVYHAESKQALYYQDDKDLGSGGRPFLKPIKFAKFPRIHYDEDSDQILLFYWANVPSADLDAILLDFETRENAGEDVTNDEQNYSIVTKAAEPFTEQGTIDETLQRIFVFTKGSLANLYDNETGSIRHQPSTFVFERPRMILKPGLFDDSNQAEPVLDIHTGGGQAVFLEFVPIP